MVSTKQRDWFSVFNPIFLVAAAILCLLPFIKGMVLGCLKG